MIGKSSFQTKKQLKSCGISIKENLNKLRIGKLAKARDKFSFRNVRNVDGRIC